MVTDIYSTDKRYDIIYADPPWQYKVWSDKGKGRSAESHYPTMHKTDIQNIPVERITSKDAVLFFVGNSPVSVRGNRTYKGLGI